MAKTSSHLLIIQLLGIDSSINVWFIAAVAPNQSALCSWSGTTGGTTNGNDLRGPKLGFHDRT